jgi:hypothetical protein
MRTLRHPSLLITIDSALAELVKEAIFHIEKGQADQHIIRVHSGAYFEHTTVSDQCCSCDPVVIYTDLITGYRVYLHRTLEA